MTTRYQLHFAPDNASLIVRLALEELGADYECVLVDRARTGHKSAAYLKLNPWGLIPVFETPDGSVFETAACLLWLADRHNGLAPAPADSARGAFLSWLFATSNSFHADLRQLFYPAQYAGADVMTLSAQRGLTLERVRAALDRYENLARAGHGWFAGAQVSLLDLYVPVLTRWLALYPHGRTDWFDLGEWPALFALAERIEARDSMRRAARAEGLGPSPLSRPTPPQPPAGTPR